MTVGHPGIGLPFGGSGAVAGRGSGFGAQIRAKDDAQEGVYFEVDGADPTWNLVTQESSDGAAEIPPVPAKLRVLGATQNAYVDLTLPGDLQGAVGADGNAVILERTDALPAAVNARGVATSAPLTVTRTAFGDSGYWFNIEARTLGQQSAPDAYFVVDGPGGVIIVGLSSSQVSDWSRVSVSYQFGSQIGVRLQPHGSARYDWLLTITYGFANNFLPVSSLTANLTSGATTISLVAKAFSPSGTTALTSLQDVMGTVRVQLTEVPLLTGSNSWHDMGRAKSCLLIVTSGLTATQAIAAVPSDFGFTVAVASGSQGTTTVLPLPQAQEFEGGSSQRAAEALAVNLNYGGRGLTRVIVKANWSDSPGEASDRHSLASLKTAWDAVTYTDMDGNTNQAVPAAAVVGSGVLGTKAQQPATFGTGADSNANTPNRRGKNLVPEVPGEEPSAVISDTSLTVRYRNSGHTTHSLEDLFDVLENHQDIAAWLRYGTPAAGEPEDPGFTRGFHHLSDDSGGGDGGGGQVIPKASSTQAEKVVYNNGDQTGLDDTGYMTVEKWSRAFNAVMPLYTGGTPVGAALVADGLTPGGLEFQEIVGLGPEMTTKVFDAPATPNAANGIGNTNPVQANDADASFRFGRTFQVEFPMIAAGRYRYVALGQSGASASASSPRLDVTSVVGPSGEIVWAWEEYPVQPTAGFPVISHYLRIGPLSEAGSRQTLMTFTIVPYQVPS